MTTRGLATVSLCIVSLLGCSSAIRNRPANELSKVLREGFPYQSNSLSFRAGGRVALDYRGYDPRNVRDSELDLGVLDAKLDGQLFDRVEFRVVGDAVGRETRGGMREAWLSRELQRAARVTAGLIRTTAGIERSFEEDSYSFIGYGFQAYLDGRTDIGARLDGELEDGIVSYELSGTIGEGFDPNGERRSGPQAIFRLVTYPFLLTNWFFSKGLFFSGGASYAPRFEGQLDIANPLGNKIFRTGRLQGGETRFQHLGYGWDLGPFRLTHEWVKGGIEDLETPTGTKVDFDNQVTAMTVTGAWMITGEHYDSRPYRQRERRTRTRPHHPVFGAAPDEANVEQTTVERPENGWGSLELAVRYSNADIDRRFFTAGFTSFQESSQEFRALTVASNWYLTANLKVTGELVRTIADQYPAVFDSHGRDTSYVVRVEWAF